MSIYKTTNVRTSHVDNDCSYIFCGNLKIFIVKILRIYSANCRDRDRVNFIFGSVFENCSASLTTASGQLKYGILPIHFVPVC
jgi:hypothetical protein